MSKTFVLLMTLAPAGACFGDSQVQRVQYHGKPFFPIGIYYHPAGKPSKDTVADLANAGFNCYHIPSKTPNDVLDEMDRLGVYAICIVGNNMLLRDSEGQKKPRRMLRLKEDPEERKEAKEEWIRKKIPLFKDKPVLLGWEGPDEPLWNWKYESQKGADIPTCKLAPEVQAKIYARIDALKDGYALVKSLDPEHPVFLNFAPRSEIEELRWFTPQKAVGGYKHDGRTCADAYGVDIYPVPGGFGTNGPIRGVLTQSIAAVGAFTRKQREIAGTAPIYIVLQGFGLSDFYPNKELKERRPTFAEERFMAFQAVANGANGIKWWGQHDIPADSLLWSDIKRVAKQLSVLEPVLAAGEVASVKCSAREVELIRYTWKGHSYVIAVNASDKPTPCAGIWWRGLESGPVNVIFENRSVAAVGGKLSDNFKPFDVHVYSDDFTSSVAFPEKVKCAFGLPLDREPFKGKTNAEIAQTLRDMGINAVCGCPEDSELIRELHRVGIKAYAEMSMFVGKQHWESHPESRPTNAEGKPIGEPSPGYCGVCPNQEWLQKEILEKVRQKFFCWEYDGLWLDYIRYAGKWEQENPALEECCFCDVCLAKFAKAAKLAYPSELKTTKDKAHWILANHRQEWTDFKCQTIADFVGQIKAEMRKANHEAILGIFNVPWKPSDLDGAITRILGQDIKRLAKHVDVFSPMAYHGMCCRPMSWIADYADFAWETTGRPVWPIVQVCDEPAKMSADEVFQTLRTGMEADGSSGIMVFTFGHALGDEGKLEALKEAFRR